MGDPHQWNYFSLRTQMARFSKFIMSGWEKVQDYKFLTLCFQNNIPFFYDEKSKFEDLFRVIVQKIETGFQSISFGFGGVGLSGGVCA